MSCLNIVQYSALLFSFLHEAAISGADDGIKEGTGYSNPCQQDGVFNALNFYGKELGQRSQTQSTWGPLQAESG